MPFIPTRGASSLGDGVVADVSMRAVDNLEFRIVK